MMRWTVTIASSSPFATVAGMTRRLRLRLFDSCVSKDDAFQPPLLSLPDSSHPFPPPPQQHLRHPPIVSSSSSCCPRRSLPHPNLSVAADAAADDLSRARETPAYLWRKEEKWHVIAYNGFSAATADAAATTSPRPKIDSEGSDVGTGIVFPPAAAMMAERRRREVANRQRRRSSKKNTKPRHPSRSRPRASTSSADNHGLFSSEDDDDEDGNREVDPAGDAETQTLMWSSQSNSTTDNSLEMELRRRKAAVTEDEEALETSPWRRLSPCFGGGEGEAERVSRESMAVVKQSEDPRADFRRSMAEMVVEKGIYEASDLEQLLHCFLSLNSQHHHSAIIAAFADVWEALFPGTPLSRSPGPGPTLLPI